MAQTVIGVFDSASDAQKAVEALVTKGFSRNNIDISSQSSGSAGSYGTTSGSTLGTDTYSPGTSASSTGSDLSSDASGAMGYPLGTSDSGRKSDHEESGITRFFKSLFGNDDEADRYSTVANRSGSIVTVHAQSNDEAEQAADILDDLGAVDIDERASQYGYTGSGTSLGTGTTGVTAGTSDLTDSSNTRSTTDLSDDATRSIPIIEEELQVGKRTVQTGGARLRSRIVERPVEESLRLREERVRVERNTVDRPATEADFSAFKEGTIELTESAEVPVVSKEARVVEEISLGKEVEERTEKVQDTVRRTEVDIEDIEKNNDVRGNYKKNDLLDD